MTHVKYDLSFIANMYKLTGMKFIRLMNTGDFAARNENMKAMPSSMLGKYIKAFYIFRLWTVTFIQKFRRASSLMFEFLMYFYFVWY